jgi:hypothetical protein
MPLILLFSAPALAARVYWTAPPDDASSAAVARTVADARSYSLDEFYTRSLPPQDGPASVAALRKELEAVRPLVDQFDGELQIMARLEKATTDVHELRSPEDRDLLWNALLFEGFAADRYFQDKLGVEPGAAPYRVGEGSAARVAPWMAACALLGVPAPTASQLPEPSQRIAYDNAQAFTRLMPSAAFVVGDLAAGAKVYLDGAEVPGGKGTRITVVPGRHFASVMVGDTVVWRTDAKVAEGKDVLIDAPYGASEHQAFTTLIAAKTEGWSVPAPAMAMIRAADEPVYLATPGGERTRLLRLDSGTAVTVAIARKAQEGSGGFGARVAVGAGWVSSGDFFLQNVNDGAPQTRATVNAGTPGVSLGGEYRTGLLAVGVGLDAQLTLGDWHSLPTGDTSTRAFLYPHAAVGLPWVQATVGPLFPFYLGLGLKAHVPIAGPLEGFASGLYGFGIARDRGEDPAFEPEAAYSAWAGVAVRLH